MAKAIRIQCPPRKNNDKDRVNARSFFITTVTIYCPIYFGYLENFAYICDT